MFRSSTTPRIKEEGERQGLGLINGHCKKFDKKYMNDYKIPNMGWLETSFIKNQACQKILKVSQDFYFVHSYHFHLKMKMIYYVIQTMDIIFLLVLKTKT